MTPSLRAVTLTEPHGGQTNVENVVGVDESEGETCVVVGVRCSRSEDIALVRALIENGLQPFQHKSSSIVRYGSLSEQERAQRVEGLMADLEDSQVSWAAVVCDRGPSPEIRAAATAVAIKKSITNGLSTGAVSHGCGDTVALHDGSYNQYDSDIEALRFALAGHIDTSFQRNICPVLLAFLQDADKIYPQTTAADYIAGYLRDQLTEVTDVAALAVDAVEQFDNSWRDDGPQPDPVYGLDPFQPVRGEGLRSRVIAWIRGQGLPDEPSPTGRDPYRELISQIDDDTVYEYLQDVM